MSKNKITKDKSPGEDIFNVETYAKSLIDYRYSNYNDKPHKDNTCVSKCNTRGTTHGRVYCRHGIMNIC